MFHAPSEVPIAEERPPALPSPAGDAPQAAVTGAAAGGGAALIETESSADYREEDDFF